MLAEWPVWILVAVVLVSLLPGVVASGRRHHQRLAIWAMVLIPATLVTGGLVLVFGLGSPLGILPLTVGGYLAPLLWLIALIWSLTAVHQVRVVAVQPPAGRAAEPLPMTSEEEREERRRQRRARGY